MANLYGVANAPGLPVNVQIGAAINCPAGTQTVIFDSGLMVAPSQGYFYPMAWVTMNFIFGATLPATTILYAQINGGANFSGYGISNAVLAPSINYELSTCFMGAPSQVPWQAPGSHFTISVIATGQPVTVSNFGSVSWIVLFRAPDQ